MWSGEEVQQFPEFAAADDPVHLMAAVARIKEYRCSISKGPRNNAAISGCEQGNSGTYLSGLSAMIKKTVTEFKKADLIVSDTQERPNISRELEAQHQYQGIHRFASPQEEAAVTLVDEECDRRSLAWIAINRFAIASGLSDLPYSELINQYLAGQLPQKLQSWLDHFKMFPVAWSVDPEAQIDRFKQTPEVFLQPFKEALLTWKPHDVLQQLNKVVTEFNNIPSETKFHLKLFRSLEALDEQEHHLRMFEYAVKTKNWKRNNVKGFYNIINAQLKALLFSIDRNEVAEDGDIRHEDMDFIIRLLNYDPGTLNSHEEAAKRLNGDPVKQAHYRAFRERVVTLMECVPVVMLGERKNSHRALCLLRESALGQESDDYKHREHFIDTILAYPKHHSRSLRAFLDSTHINPQGIEFTGRQIISELLAVYSQYLLDHDDFQVLQKAGGNLALLRHLPPANRRVVLPLEKLRDEAYAKIKQVFNAHNVPEFNPNDMSLLLNSLLHTINEYPVVFGAAKSKRYDCVVYPGTHAPIVEARRMFNGDTDYGDAAEAGLYVKEPESTHKVGKRAKPAGTSAASPTTPFWSKTGGTKRVSPPVTDDDVEKLLARLETDPTLAQRFHAAVNKGVALTTSDTEATCHL